MLSALLCTLLASGPAVAQVAVPVPTRGEKAGDERPGGPFGLGVALGSPTGIATSFWFNDWSSVQFSVGGNLGRYGDVGVTGDYLIHFRPFQTESAEYSVPLHIGAGMKLGSNIEELSGLVMLGPRLNVGATVIVKELPVDLFVDVVPTLFVYEELSWAFDGQIGLRYYF
jgi:hypothetical protein